MRQLTGKATVYVDGTKMEMERGAKANPGGISRTFERHHGRTYALEGEAAPSVEGSILHTKDTDAQAISAIDNATVIFECDTGQKYVMRGASIENPIDIDGGSGKSPIKLVGDSFEKM
jgi:hypothetical protein